jgi:anti-anti-sigma regulatory factor
MTVVRLRGEYDASRRDELDAVLDRYGDAEPLTFDCGDVDRLDATALRSLLRFQLARKEAGRSPPVFTRLSDGVRAFFRGSEMESAFDIRDG